MLRMQGISTHPSLLKTKNPRRDCALNFRYIIDESLLAKIEFVRGDRMPAAASEDNLSFSDKGIERVPDPPDPRLFS